MRENQQQTIVIIGGGVIGCSAAYYLTKHPLFNPECHRIKLIEATTIAGGASGKAGGCLASWATPTCLAPLSFQLHHELAAQHDGARRWGYRRANCFDCTVSQQNTTGVKPGEALPESDSISRCPPDWVYPGRITSCDELGVHDNTGQVHPFLFTTFLADESKASGVEFLFGSVTSIDYSKDGQSITSVSYLPKDSETPCAIKADHAVLAAGPWTPNILPKVPVKGARSHSIVLKVPTTRTSPDVLFFNKTDPNYWFPKLEVYPRPDNTTYICGPTDFRVPLPSSTAEVEVDEDSCQLIQRAGESLSEEFVGREIVVKQACYRPVVTSPGRPRSVGPLLGKTAISGLILATGHDQWGMQNSAATGKIVAELILDGKAVSADITTLDPGDVV